MSKSDSSCAEFDPVSTRSKIFPAWAFLSLVTNGILMVAVILLLQEQRLNAIFQAISPSGIASLTSTTQPGLPGKTPSTIRANTSVPILGPRHQLNYDQWVEVLEQEANVATEKRPQHLTILAGDSLSLWFPTDLLPTERSWLNQGISGETSAGLLRRLKLFDHTQPETIFVMIGINDLIRGIKDETILENQRLIVRRLLRVHPQAQIVVQSILPHGGEHITWEGRLRLLAVSHSRIRQLNQQLSAIANQEGVNYLDLHSLFTDADGNLRPELSTDGLHLSFQGYLVWRAALQIYSQLKLAPQIDPRVGEANQLSTMHSTIDDRGRRRGRL